MDFLINQNWELFFLEITFYSQVYLLFSTLLFNWSFLILSMKRRIIILKFSILRLIGYIWKHLIPRIGNRIQYWIYYEFSNFSKIFGFSFLQTKQKSMLFNIMFPRNREHFNLACIHEKFKVFGITQFKIFFKQSLSFINIYSNPKRNSYHKCILQKETHKNPEKCFKIAMEIDIPAVHPKDNMWEL